MTGRRGAPSDRALRDAWLIERSRRSTPSNRGVYGAPRIHAELRMAHGVAVGAQARGAADARGRALAGWSRRKRGRTTIRVPGVRVADDLVERAASGPRRPNVLWVADITYLRTWEGWLYLAAVQDAYSRADRRLGDGRPHALRARRRRAADGARAAAGPAPGLIHHSDQGSQFVVTGVRPDRPRRRHRASRWAPRATAYDNAVAESFFATLKKELVHRRSWPTRRELTRRGLRVHRGVLQPDRAALDPRDALARRVRGQHAAGDPDGLAGAARARARAKTVHNLRLPTATTTTTHTL